MAILTVHCLQTSLVTQYLTIPNTPFIGCPTRAWQMLAGVLTYEWFNVRKVSKGIAITITWLGLVCIVLPMMMISHITPFPGFAAIPSTLGAACLLAGMKEHGGLIKTLLSSRWMANCGLISYSLYLALAAVSVCQLLLPIRNAVTSQVYCLS